MSQQSQQTQLSHEPQQQQPQVTEDPVPEQKKKWTPLECAPEVLQDCVAKYGVHDTIISEVFGAELFDMVPQPIEALIVLFPVAPDIKDFINTTFPVDNSIPKSSLFHMNQRIGNACGTFALFHTFLNLRQVGDVEEDSVMDKLLVKMCELPEGTTSLDCAKLFENQPGVEEIHQGMGEIGQTDAADYEFTEVHYITFICKFGTMWLLDGEKKGPLNLGPCTQDELLTKAFGVAAKMHAIWGKETDFAVLAASKLD